MIQVLIIEDDSDLAAGIGDYLSLQGCECDFAYNGMSGVQMAREFTFDVIILDLMLPKLNGFGVCEQLREQGCFTPVLMLTACDTQEDQLQGFCSGVDDYVVKPCVMPLLWARVQALYRRGQKQESRLRVDSLTMILDEYRVEREGVDIKLTPTGWKLLEQLMRASPKVVSRRELEQAAWPDSEVDSGNFNVQIHQLRKALDKPFSYPLIHTKVGVGFYLRKE